MTAPLNFDVEWIFNLACPSSPIHYQREPIQTMKTNVLGAINVLDLAVKNKATIFQASTSEVYGDPEEHPQKESYWGKVNPYGVRSCYDEGKRAVESLFFDYHRQHKLEIRVARIFNTYGPQMKADDGRIVSNFIIQALKGDDITIYGTGKQTRSYCFVDDMVLGITALMNKEQFTGPVNLGNPQEFTVLELAEKVLKLTGSKSKLAYKKLPEDDPQKRCPDITLAKTALNWTPQVELEDGLQRTIAYFKKTLV